ncbi:vacuolar protein sorting-associated protein 11 homolog [Nephila pilipes]|uniref:Vacuolar protein sorting-associated protein 11 homolog n=1 Tax=Nephila pilipes TaxID=299642 RepID=A0A8X6Q136_NEPPI|nr:vacuolar protein sorting-associated protein 11 homolog [Nephila pilipes]
MQKHDYQFVIGCHDAVYFISMMEEVHALLFKERILLHWFRSYLVVVGKDNKAVPHSSAMTSPVEMNIVTGSKLTNEVDQLQKYKAIIYFIMCVNQPNAGDTVVYWKFLIGREC